MKIELYYRYSDLDKEPQFGLVVENKEGYETYARWIWYYLGASLGVERPTLYPFQMSKGKLLKSYKYCNDAKRQGLLIANKIKKKLEKL